MHRFIIFMRINQGDDDIDYKCYFKNLLRFLKKTLQEKGLIKDSRNFAILDYWKLWLFKGTPMQIWKSANIFVVKWQ